MLGKDLSKKVTPNPGDRWRREEWGKFVTARLGRSAQHQRTQAQTTETGRRLLRRPAWLAAGAAGAGLMFWLDPATGRRRRAVTQDRIAAVGRQAWRRLGRTRRRIAADAYGLSQKVTHLRPADQEAPNDAALAQRVASEIFRDPDVPKGRINVNVEEGTVVLRGALDRPEQIRDLETAARKVHGVKDVRSLLHLVDTPPPTAPDAYHASAQ